MQALEKISDQRLFGGRQMRFAHDSKVLSCRMQFSVYLPPQTAQQDVPALYWLSGLTCTDENFSAKAGAQRIAAELGIALVIPDTSPRGEQVPDDPEGAYDFGLGAGFYVNATEAPFAKHYQMYDYISKELPALVEAELPLSTRRSISGHSMGGHGALVMALRESGRYCSVSAFAPISNPINCPWGRKALAGYLGKDESSWQSYDASVLLAQHKTALPILVDQGDADQFLAEQLKPEALLAASTISGSDIELRIQPGYDHSYYF
ncbi:S-formylglutathione hydrolase, partial [Alkalimonas sp.]|uniref:S-formylglutathione hydrolase n=1 Tax=Alkalimonas sp. TaxID=1872453 RepID=UPI00263BD2A2